MERIASLLLLFSLIFLVFVFPGCNQAQTSQPESSRSGSLPPPPKPRSLPLVLTPQPQIFCPEITTSLVTGTDLFQTPSIDEPEPRQPFLDPRFGTCLIRATDRNADVSSDDPSLGLKNEYSRVQSFNADASLFIIRGTEATWYLYDAQSFQPLRELPLGVEPRWDTRDPHLLYYSDESRFMAYNIQTGESSLVHDFSDAFPGHELSAVWSRYEGSPSIDGRYWGFMAQDADWQVIGLLIYDLAEDRIIARRDISGDPEIDSVTISPHGSYFLAYFDFCEPGQLGIDEHPCGLMVYDHNLENGRGLLRVIGHSDTALDAQRNEILVYQDIDTDDISMLDLATGDVTPLWPIDFSHTPIGLHFSGRSFDAPGWALISTSSGGHPEDYTWMDDSVFAVELKGGGQVVRLAHTHSLVDEDQEHDYWAEPHATVNADFTRILFTSNWGRSGTGEVETYMIQLPENWHKE